ncbi:hypothetical protein M3568_18275 [Priestia flexa]|uniref:hypothetical protein n=1 Tax=Priestia flexa TaxID=86664 RepID=UPI00203C8A31|nr:hypothetical protein [Priestia flexa]MCM3068274.1 hypothetical protein [Priestia flexa]
MWKIENSTNTQYLLKFESEIILPLFSMICDIVIEIEKGKIKLPLERVDIWKNTNVFLGFSTEQKKLFSYIMQKTVSGEKLQDYFYLIAVTFDSSYVERLFKLYKEQNSKVFYGNYDIPQIQIDEYFKGIFVSYFYNVYFVDDYVWGALVGERYNRKSFHRNFKLENKMVVCPYCDIDTTVAGSNNNIEHFLPKSKYPLISMNPLNLISSCYACNKADEGKGDRIPDSPIISPYNEMIGDFAGFDIDFLSKKITLHNTGGKAHDNYFKLLKLYSRYSDPIVFECVDNAAHSLFETLSNFTSPTKESIDLYNQRRERMNNLSFALKSVIGKYSQYEAYK